MTAGPSVGTPRSLPAAGAKDLCLTLLGLSCLHALLEEAAGFDGPVWLVIGLVVGIGFWLALVAWGWATYRERRRAAGSTGALARPWVLPLLLVAGVLAGAFFLASLG